MRLFLGEFETLWNSKTMMRQSIWNAVILKEKLFAHDDEGESGALFWLLLCIKIIALSWQMYTKLIASSLSCSRSWASRVFLVFCILKRQNCLCHFHPFSIKEPPFRNCIVLAKECRITHVERHLAVLSKALPKKLWKRRGARANTSWIEVNPIWWSWANAENCMVFFGWY